MSSILYLTIKLFEKQDWAGWGCGLLAGLTSHCTEPLLSIVTRDFLGMRITLLCSWPVLVCGWGICYNSRVIVSHTNMSARILSAVPWRPFFLREKERYINASSSDCHHDVLQEHKPSPGNILCHAGSPPCLWCLLEGCFAMASSGNPSLPPWRTHSSWQLLLLCGEFQITVTHTKLNPAHASYINWVYFILIYVNDRQIMVWFPAGARDFSLLQNFGLAPGTNQSPVRWILRFISLGQAWSTFHVVWATSAKFGLHADNMKFSR
jgi:hypothetical protein